MFGVVKVAALSAVLAAALVIATEAPKPPSTSARILTDRLDLETRKSIQPEDACRGAWPYADTACATDRAAEPARTKPIRTIEIDRRDGGAKPELQIPGRVASR